MLNRIRRNAGRTRFRWLDLVVLGAAGLLVVQAPLSVVEAAWVPNLHALPRLAMLGLLVGYVVERTRLPGTIGLPMAAVLGVEAITSVYAQLAGPISLADGVDWLGGRLGAWLDVVASGGVSNDPLVFALAMAGLAWLLGMLTAWLVFRDGAPWVAVLFNGVGLLMNLSYAASSLVGYITWFAFATCLLLAAHQLAQRTELWRRAELRVSWRVVANVLAGTALAAGGMLSVAWALPANGSNPEIASGFTRATAPWQGLEGGFDRWFASLNATDRTARGLSFGRTLAPRGSFDLGDTPVLALSASAPLYLRATTADRYAGQAITSSETGTRQFDANTDLVPQEQIPLGRGLMQAQVKVLASRTSVAFAADAPMRFSLPGELDTRGTPDDVATVRFETPVLQNQEYTFVSAVSTATIQDLRVAGEQYSDAVRRRYLQLPRSVPRRVIDLAREVTSGATSAYDRAAAIESYLRSNLTYSTHVSTVPPDRDWVDYFLFDSKEGYCDYFATAMVVMLRAEGVPARVASGFAPGDLDTASGAWMVRENNAHSWVEAYFPGYGWITFEPSAIRPVPPRLEQAPAPPPQALPPSGAVTDTSGLTSAELDELLNIHDLNGAGQSGSWWTTLPGVLALTGAGLLVLVVVGTGLITLAWRRGLGALNGSQLPYAQLIRLGHWSGAPLGVPSDTPLEVAERLGRQVPSARPVIRDLTNAYVEATYAGRPASVNPLPAWLTARGAVVRGLLLSRWRSRRQREQAPGS